MTDRDRARGPLDRAALPEPVLDAEPALVELYWVAWELAWEHVVEREGVAQSPYLDEGFDPETIWIWDTCFMAHFCKYAPELFPGIESLDNFYRPMYDGAPSSLKIQHPDNPPLFAWAEEEYVRHTGDLDRVEWLLRSGYLQRHFAFFETVAPGSVFGYSNIPTAIERTRAATAGTASAAAWTTRRGLRSRAGAARTATSSGSTPPRSRRSPRGASPGWPGWSATTRWRAEYDDGTTSCWPQLVNTSGTTTTASTTTGSTQPPYELPRVRTPAAYWPLLAGVCDADAGRRAGRAADRPGLLRGAGALAVGRPGRPGVPADRALLARRRLGAHGLRGARALADHGHADLAHAASLQLVRHLARTYADYAAGDDLGGLLPRASRAPSTAKDDAEIARPDFCGWSALAPIAMLIEHVLGFRVDAPERTVHWRRNLHGRNGIRRLRCGSATVSLVTDGSTVTVELDQPLRLVVDGSEFHLDSGAHTFDPSG